MIHFKAFAVFCAILAVSQAKPFLEAEVQDLSTQTQIAMPPLEPSKRFKRQTDIQTIQFPGYTNYNNNGYGINFNQNNNQNHRFDDWRHRYGIVFL